MYRLQCPALLAVASMEIACGDFHYTTIRGDEMYGKYYGNLPVAPETEL